MRLDREFESLKEEGEEDLMEILRRFEFGVDRRVGPEKQNVEVAWRAIDNGKRERKTQRSRNAFWKRYFCFYASVGKLSDSERDRVRKRRNQRQSERSFSF